MTVALTYNELTNLVCDVFDENGEDYNFDELEKMIQGLDEDVHEDLYESAKRGDFVAILDIVEGY